METLKNKLNGIVAVVADDCIVVTDNTFKYRLWLGHKHKGGGRYDKITKSWFLPLDRRELLISYFTLTGVNHEC